MTYKSLRHFMNVLEKEGLLKRVTRPVSTSLEMTEIQRRLLKTGGVAVLFEKPIMPNGDISDIPVLVNLFGTVERIARGITTGGQVRTQSHELREVGQMLAFLQRPEPPKGFRDALNMVPFVKAMASMRQVIHKKPACQEVIWRGDEIDLNKLPIQGCWPNEPAPLITWPLIVTKGPSGASEDNFNLGIYRMQLLDKNKTIMRWLKHRGGAQHHQRWKQKKSEPLPAAAVIGCDPATILGAVTPVPDTLSEYQFSGLLRGSKTELAECVSVPLKVPAEAEIVLEGYVSLDEYADEGPYGDHTGYYNCVEKFPVFTITAVTMRKNPIYLSTFTGRPPDEPSVLGEALNEIFIPLIQQQFPEIIDFWLPPEGCSYRIAVVSIKKAYAGHAKRIMAGVWSYLRQFMYTKFVIIVDHDINCRDWKDVMWAISTRSDASRDLTIIQDTPIDYLDFASPKSGLGGKLGIDATNKVDSETDREWGDILNMSDDIIEKIDMMWEDLNL